MPASALFAVGACAVVGATDESRARTAQSQVKPGMVAAEVFDVVERQISSSRGYWTALLAGYGCLVEGQKRTWVLSQFGKAYKIATHLEETPFGGQGDHKTLSFTDAAQVRAFLTEGSFTLCETYQVGFGRWGFGITSGDSVVESVLPVEHYEYPD